MSDAKKGLLIGGVVEHGCGWVSDGGSFYEGAGCPKCGKRIFIADLLTLPSDDAELRNEREDAGRERLHQTVSSLLSDIVISFSEWLASLTVEQFGSWVLDVETHDELEQVRRFELEGSNRVGVLAAIDGQKHALEKCGCGGERASREDAPKGEK